MELVWLFKWLYAVHFQERIRILLYLILVYEAFSRFIGYPMSLQVNDHVVKQLVPRSLDLD